MVMHHRFRLANAHQRYTNTNSISNVSPTSTKTMSQMSQVSNISPTSKKLMSQMSQVSNISPTSKKLMSQMSQVAKGAPQFFAQTGAGKEHDGRSFFRWKRVSL